MSWKKCIALTEWQVTGLHLKMKQKLWRLCAFRKNFITEKQWHQGKQIVSYTIYSHIFTFQSKVSFIEASMKSISRVNSLAFSMLALEFSQLCLHWCWTSFNCPYWFTAFLNSYFYFYFLFLAKLGLCYGTWDI